MMNQGLKDAVVSRILPSIRTPGQYVGGELNSIVKDHRTACGSVCLAFPDTYALGMSHHGLQVLYSLMNAAGWACERAFTPLPDFEEALKQHDLPLYSLETFHTALQVRCPRLFASVRDLLHECVNDARARWNRAPLRGSRAGRHAGHRRRARCPESRIARAVYRSVRDRRWRAEPAGRLRPVEVDARFRACRVGKSWPGSRQPSTGRTSRGFMNPSTAKTVRFSRSAAVAMTFRKKSSRA